MMSSRRRSISTAGDRISTLPDPILCHILSFLPTKLSVATSIISKRWKPLWQSVLTLDFDGESLEDSGSFRDFLYSVFISRDATLPLKSFRIRFGRSDNFDPYDLNRFIHAAVQRGLENFELELNVFLYDRKEIIPGLLRLLSCKTLVLLKLNSLTVYSVPHVDLPLLKTLHLEEIDFVCSVAHFVNLVRGCPILENFYTNEVTLPGIGNDSVGEFKGFSKLLRAKLCYSDGNFPFAWLHNAKFLCAQLQSTTYEYQVPTFHNLTNMELIFYSDSLSWKWKFVIQVLQHCPNLQNLTLDEENDVTLPTGDKDWTEPETIPECLSSQLRKCCLRGFDGIECELQFTEYILLNSKLLCTMTVNSNPYLDDNEKLQMLVKLSSYPRGSVTCKLLFD